MASLHLYLASRLIGGAGFSPAGERLGYGLFGALFLSIPLGIIVARMRPDIAWLSGPARWVSFIWLGTFGVVLSATLGTDLIRLALRLAGVTVNDAGRWQALAIVALAIPAAIYSVFVARGPARVERVRITLPNLGPGMEGLRIAQISDIHIGETLDGKFLERLVRDVNALRPDVIAVTGDLVDGSVEALREEVRPLGKLSAPLGVFFVTGNHEYYSGADEWAEEVRRFGLTVLHNEHRVLERGGSRLVVGGVTDFSGGQFHPRHASRPDVAFADAPPTTNAPRVLLAHQPRSAQAAKAADVDLQLSGHTHGGQIFPFHFFVRLQQPAVRGLKRIFGVQVYTHRGSGYWGPPMRLGASPEIAEITLTSKP